MGIAHEVVGISWAIKQRGVVANGSKQVAQTGKRTKSNERVSAIADILLSE
jgi:hypothetical protein